MPIETITNLHAKSLLNRGRLYLPNVPFLKQEYIPHLESNLDIVRFAVQPNLLTWTSIIKLQSEGLIKNNWQAKYKLKK